MEPLEWILIVALLLSGGGNIKQKMALSKQGKKIEKHALVEIENAKKIEENQNKIKMLITNVNDKDKALLVVQTAADEKQKELEKQIATDVSVAFEQAKDIYNEHDSPFTREHVETLTEYVKTWGYSSMAQVIKWNMEVIRKQQSTIRQVKAERLKLLTERDTFRSEKHDLQIDLSKTMGRQDILIKENSKLGADGKVLAKQLNEKIASVAGLSGMVAEYLWAIKIGAVILLFVFGGNIWQAIKGYLFKKKQGIEMVVKERAQQELIKRNQLIKKFMKYDADGNGTMLNLLEAEEIDLHEDGNGGAGKAMSDEFAKKQEYLKEQREKLSAI